MLPGVAARAPRLGVSGGEHPSPEEAPEGLLPAVLADVRDVAHLVPFRAPPREVPISRGGAAYQVLDGEGIATGTTFGRVQIEAISFLPLTVTCLIVEQSGISGCPTTWIPP